ncbi:uncharacterized protein EV154DRAFT_483555 [Mucor mucedo]|uniref:uncharacterized protein n=1 Tax=Mucor mucedo TaxID=29922 RepID=UPI00221F5A8A|nr:uncharacterized protein EV154DRAFT_483555 [Mucor mucedo]KAI7889018.1 hypothetical protein EV154DRAFT_483555 [Mucor mucedo]
MSATFARRKNGSFVKFEAMEETLFMTDNAPIKTRRNHPITPVIRLSYEALSRVDRSMMNIESESWLLILHIWGIKCNRIMTAEIRRDPVYPILCRRTWILKPANKSLLNRIKPAFKVTKPE